MQVQTYQTKPQIKEAVQFDGTTKCECYIATWMESCGRKDDYHGTERRHDGHTLLINTKQGAQALGPTDYIIRNPDGEFYPCNAKTFESSYELITDSKQKDDGMVIHIPKSFITEVKALVKEWL